MLSRSRFLLLVCGVTLAMVFVTGCGDKPADTLPGNPVKGKVTVNGKEPGTFCSIEFVSSANPSESGSAGVEPSGVYGGRVPLGKCKVALKLGGPPAGSSGGGGNPYAKGGAGFSKGGGPTGPPGGAGNGGAPTGPPQTKGSDIPKKFQDVKTSGIEVEVVAGQDLNIDFK